VIGCFGEFWRSNRVFPGHQASTHIAKHSSVISVRNISREAASVPPGNATGAAAGIDRRGELAESVICMYKNIQAQPTAGSLCDVVASNYLRTGSQVQVCNLP
jgi:hypothetical protein